MRKPKKVAIISVHFSEICRRFFIRRKKASIFLIALGAKRVNPRFVDRISE